MLLGSTNNKNAVPEDESFIIQLLLQQRYAQAYQLLMSQQANQSSSLYNMALCLCWAGNYQEAINRLESIQLTSRMGTTDKLNVDNNFRAIMDKQNQTADYLLGMTETFTKAFPELLTDAIIRLKTDCWLQLGNYDKVTATAMPIAHKGYKNITDALQLANENDKRI